MLSRYKSVMPEFCWDWSNVEYSGVIDGTSCGYCYNGSEDNSLEQSASEIDMSSRGKKDSSIVSNF